MQQQHQQDPNSPDECPQWCVLAHLGEEPGEFVHRSNVESVGKFEIYLARYDGVTRTVFQIGSETFEAEGDEDLTVMAKVIWYRALRLGQTDTVTRAFEVLR